MINFNNSPPGIKNKNDSYVDEYGHTHTWWDAISNYHITEFNREVLKKTTDPLLDQMLEAHKRREVTLFEETWYLMIEDKDENAVDLL